MPDALVLKRSDRDRGQRNVPAALRRLGFDQLVLPIEPLKDSGDLERSIVEADIAPTEAEQFALRIPVARAAM